VRTDSANFSLGYAFKCSHSGADIKKGSASIVILLLVAVVVNASMPIHWVVVAREGVRIVDDLLCFDIPMGAKLQASCPCRRYPSGF